MGGHNIVEAARATQEWRHSYAEPFLAPQTCQTSPAHPISTRMMASCQKPHEKVIQI
jgi:hypothetical protein